VSATLRGDRAFVSVHDTGIGVPAHARERIFESFEQADGSTAREFGGTGLGLAVTKQLVELHRGRIEVDSTPGEGSRFTFDVARADRQAAEGDAREEVPPRVSHLQAGDSMLLRASARVDDVPSPRSGDDGDAPPLSGRARIMPGTTGHVVVADDDPVNVEVLRAQLEPAGYAVTTARDGAEAVAALAAMEHVDGVLLDVMMPKMTGVEAARKIRETHPHGTLPILMLTAKSRPEDVIVGMRAGASDYIGKPFHREELLHRVDAHVQSLKTARAFRRFVPEDFLALLGVEHFDALRSGIGQQRTLTILFTDVRGFTARSERLGPEATFRFINGCLERFEPVVRRHGGFVDKFIGDAVMAIFPGEPLEAVRAAEELHREVAAVNAGLAHTAMPLEIGVGVHRGSLMLGTVGDDERLEVTAIGDVVNVAARLEALTKVLGAGALVSEDVVPRLLAGTRRVGAMRVKGRAAPVELFELLGCCASADERAQKEATAERFQRGLRAYAQGDVNRALEHFAIVLTEAPLDRVADLYAAQCRKYAATQLPDGFDGSLHDGTY
jgi:two-component system sensor histidine kinase ChiS